MTPPLLDFVHFVMAVRERRHYEMYKVGSIIQRPNPPMMLKNIKG